MRKVIYIGLIIALCWFAEDCARAAELHVPQNAVAGQPLSIGTSGSGTLYLIGPGQVIKKEFQIGGSVEIKGEELRSAGRWIAAVRGDSNQSQVFWVKPGKPGKLNFLARPSRVPVARPNVISGVTFVFDQYQNLILDPTPVKFNLSVGGAGSTKSVTSREGVAWINSASRQKRERRSLLHLWMTPQWRAWCNRLRLIRVSAVSACMWPVTRRNRTSWRQILSAIAAAIQCRTEQLLRSSRLTKPAKAQWTRASRRARPAPSCLLRQRDHHRGCRRGAGK